MGRTPPPLGSESLRSDPPACRVPSSAPGSRSATNAQAPNRCRAMPCGPNCGPGHRLWWIREGVAFGRPLPLTAWCDPPPACFQSRTWRAQRLPVHLEGRLLPRPGEPLARREASPSRGHFEQSFGARELLIRVEAAEHRGLALEGPRPDPISQASPLHSYRQTHRPNPPRPATTPKR